MDHGVRWAGAMAVASAVGAAVIGIVVVDIVLGNPAGSFDVLVVPPAVVAAAILGGTLWWALVERPESPTDGRAVTVGFLVGLLAHPLAWLLYVFGGPLFLPGEWSEPQIMIEVALAFAVLSLLFSGVLTIAGGVLCAVVVLRCRRYVHGA